ncbi:YcjX-like family protein [Dinoroseobacter shibae DFL 12 = DSM 16493]|uniref:YcjX-like family protein n=2 Tax=Pseudomonadota TaxID=1224 RepID=A8LNZ6_DINSH|nr:YcjX family protein [Dinoroseobacter shibae]ABV93678.1 YcjX-like family protein [Dinoroseobacter shibae DFL 12 = DSM 16493]URF45131.1 YcjX family protein [Dinoroseobacter shibae]URF49436.1 YcjX family protein [Dinoroseobacter shibae]
MVFSTLTDTIERGVTGLGSAVSETFFEPVIRLGVTGLSRSGKTVFITSLVANLLDRGRMPQFQAAATGALQSAYLQPQPDDTVPRFDFETSLAQMTGRNPTWPESTRAISELRVSLRVQPQGFLGALSRPRTVHLDIVDYPGEWLLDLALLDKTYAEWSADILVRLRTRPGAEAFLAALEAADPAAKLAEPDAQALARAYTQALHAARAAGYSDCTPGRFILPGELEGSPVLTFAPLPPGPYPRGALGREFERRFEAYKREVAKPFFRDHFSRIDRQIVLIDALGALHAGPGAVEDLRATMQDILSAFRPGANSWLSAVLGRRVERILFAATKADHLHHSQHPQLTAIMEALVRDARRRADFAGAETGAMSIAALRTTVEETRVHEGRSLDLVRGTLLETGKQAAFFAGELPKDPNQVLGPARDGETSWLDGDYAAMRFAPARISLAPGEGPPHIRLDRAAEFLLGDRLR